MQREEFEDAKLLWKMFYAGECFKHAQAAAEFVLQNSIGEDNPVFYPLVTAVYVLYGKPFKPSHGVGFLEDGIVPSEYQELHRELLKHRDQIYAHSDAAAFKWFDVGQVNQVRLVRRATGKSLVCSQFQAKPPLIPHIISLCQMLREKAERNKMELFTRYEKYVPAKVGEYVLNIDDPDSDFFKPTRPVVEANP